MDIQSRLLNLLNVLNGLDTRKKIGIIAGVMISIIAALVISVTLNKPATQSIYTNLSREDINAMSRILAENNIGFSANPDSGSLSVGPAMVGRSRMILAEHGLPSSQESGYELFDRMNTIGLTSFMQDVTNKRAIEGELVRTIQMIAGINSARVHIVMPEKNVYRRALGGAPTASVVLKTYGRLPSSSIYAVRHMVAAAVPSLDVANVTIVDANGTLLTSAEMTATNKLVDLEREFEKEAQAKVASALGAHLGGENYRVSVTAKLNSDLRRSEETLFDPDSKVERSTQIVREAGSSQNKETSQATTIEQSLPDAAAEGASGQSSLENNERREESTQYEINRKRVEVVSEGYAVESLSVALVVNKARINALLGANPSQADVDAKLADLEAIVRSALSIRDDRGDAVKVSMVEFMPTEAEAAAGEPFSLMRLFTMHTGALINAIGLIIAALLFALLGIRPLLAFLSRSNPDSAPRVGALPPNGGAAVAQAEGSPQLTAGAAAGSNPALSSQGQTAGLAGVNPAAESIEAIARQEAELRDKLEEFVSEGGHRSAIAIRQWLKQDGVPVTVDA
ncbi:flagellar basal-body MS-ring/collar protein FliF [Salaquimonas pukyongi]|uniref:flagellar basal-body MS-ring/collar protein FliF n=1 Tax=Salaquimonas pukyongi TaxID=2712698 RepID=UPI00096BAA21|nr:flagellar basal-body MS-ring/collar protein FliF [Salaquimonas pukyongi]